MKSKAERVLLVNLPYYEDIFGRSTVKAAVSPTSIIMSLAAIAPAVRQQGDQIRILDLNLSKLPLRTFRETLEAFQPSFVGFTFTTAIFHLARRYASAARVICPSAKIVGGGPHASVLPEDVLTRAPFDIVVRGEGDFSLAEIVRGENIEKIPGISYIRNREVVHNPDRPNLPNLDSVPLPALDLYDVSK